MYTYIHIYMYICIFLCIYIYVYGCQILVNNHLKRRPKFSNRSSQPSSTHKITVKLTSEMFLQFLFDDHIKSRLLRDVNFFRKEKKSLHNRYPYDRAQEFHTEIRRLGNSREKVSFIGLFCLIHRSLLSHS